MRRLDGMPDHIPGAHPIHSRAQQVLH
jgi:hypothetical protein